MFIGGYFGGLCHWWGVVEVLVFGGFMVRLFYGWWDDVLLLFRCFKCSKGHLKLIDKKTFLRVQASILGKKGVLLFLLCK
jgi:hypothetical protein